MKQKLLGIMFVAFGFQINAAAALNLKPIPAYAAKKNKLSIDALTRNVEYAFCKADVPAGDQSQLNELAEFLGANQYVISLRGHADAIGTYLGNWKMSEARAAAVKTYLIKKGVAEDRIVTTAFGSTIPIANNKTSRGRQKNRRVEIRLKQIGS